MAEVTFRRIDAASVFKAEALPVDAALAMASLPGGCAGNRYPVFVEVAGEVAAEHAPGGYCEVVFMLPGKPGRWRASGEVVASVSTATDAAPTGLGIELLGLALTSEATDAEQPSPDDAESSEAGASETFDATQLGIEEQDVAGMLRDLLGRKVTTKSSSKLTKGFAEHDVIGSFHADNGETVFLIGLDKAGAARIGGALTMIDPETLEGAIEAEAPLEGDSVENAKEVLNIMSALFHEGGSPHVVLGDTITGEELATAKEGQLQAVMDEMVWALGIQVDIEEYGTAEVLLVAKNLA